VWVFVCADFVMCVSFGNVKLYLPCFVLFVLRFLLFRSVYVFLLALSLLPPSDNSIAVNNNNNNNNKILSTFCCCCNLLEGVRSGWSCGLRHGSATARLLLEMRGRIHQGQGTLSVLCCDLAAVGLYDGPIRRPQQSY
jgi:hypothetical protein